MLKIVVIIKYSDSMTFYLFIIQLLFLEFLSRSLAFFFKKKINKINTLFLNILSDKKNSKEV